MTAAAMHEPVMELIRASMDPAGRHVTLRKDHPACQVVIRAAKADLTAGGTENVNRLAVGAGVAAAGLTALLAEHRGLEPGEFVDQIDATPIPGPGVSPGVVEMLRSLLTGAAGMRQTAELVVRMPRDDEEGYYDLIVDLGDYAAACTDLLNTLGVSGTEDTLAELDGMLRGFYGA
ncbi:hypothetical protein I3F58_11040 [Streptomyces sp. MUM 203J]|uniref:hypothetical protein n=1 Tax=Streptomyces sp. MUM 203J TaxID=2791990 RepID=UPI001F03584B|nr:hypothetical protein [Streptomyces sp. MUM 203J]MCH0540093.1 hypothetical protein [Streptomyces sp. MUM 203J]